MLRAFIIHGWGGNPEEAWLPWLKKELEKNGFRVTAPAMPETDSPRIETWVPALDAIIGAPDEHTFLVGHSIGCQAILRYLEGLGGNEKIGGVVLVAGWMTLTPESTPTDEERAIAKPWVEIPIAWEKVRARASTFTAIFSDNDPDIPLANVEIFRENLNAEITMEHNKGHFTASDGVTELPSSLDAVLRHAAR